MKYFLKDKDDDVIISLEVYDPLFKTDIRSEINMVAFGLEIINIQDKEDCKIDAYNFIYDIYKLQQLNTYDISNLNFKTESDVNKYIGDKFKKVADSYGLKYSKEITIGGIK